MFETFVVCVCLCVRLFAGVNERLLVCVCFLNACLLNCVRVCLFACLCVCLCDCSFDQLNG